VKEAKVSPTKQEIAEGLTVAQLREVADAEGVDITGLSAKQDIADAVAASVSKDALSDAADDTTTDNDTSSSPSPSTSGPPAEGVSAGLDPLEITHDAVGLSDKLSDLQVGPTNPPAPDVGVKAPRADSGAVGHDPEALQKAGLSPADMELPTAGAYGDPIIVKQNPETPNIKEVANSLTTVPGPPNIEITITEDGEDKNLGNALGVGDRAQAQQRALAANSNHPAHITEGHWSNPNLTEMTDEEKEADQKAYAARFGG
jgi:hypothetical protein